MLFKKPPVGCLMKIPAGGLFIHYFVQSFLLIFSHLIYICTMCNVFFQGGDMVALEFFSPYNYSTLYNMPLHNLTSLIHTKTTTLTFPSKPSATIPPSPIFRRL